MAEKPDLLDLLAEGYGEAVDIAVQSVRRVRAEALTRPADPHAKRLSEEERLADYQHYRQDPAYRQAKFAETSNKFATEPGRVPRRLVDYILDGERLQKKRERGEFDRLIDSVETEE